MNLNNYLTKSARMAEQPLLDSRKLKLNIVINIDESKVEAITNKIYNCFVQPFVKKCVLLTFCDNREYVATKSFVDKFLKHIFTSRSGAKYSAFGYAGVLSSEKIKYRKDLLADDEKGSYEYERDVHEMFVENIIKSIEKCEDRQKYMAQIFEKMIETEYPHHLDSNPYDIDLLYDLSSTFDGFYQGSCEFDISLYSLDGKVDEIFKISWIKV